MIYQDIQITVNQGLAVPDKSLYIFRGDSNIILNFKLVTPQYMLTKDNKDNLVTRFGVDNFELRLQLEKDYNKIIRGVITTDGYCRTQLTQNVIQELRKGTYDYQITLIDDDNNAIMTFPVCKAKFNILDRMSLSAEELAVPGGLSGEAMTDLSVIVESEGKIEAFDSNGNYIKTNWKPGDVISSAKLNKIEEGIDGVNKKAQQLDAKKFDKNGILSMTNMGQDVKEAMTGGSVAVVGNNSILNGNIVDKQVSINKLDFIEESSNLYNVAKRSNNYTIDASGNTVYNDLYYTSDYINVMPDEKYTIAGFATISYFTFDGTFIKRDYLTTLFDNYVVVTVTMPSNVGKIRLTAYKRTAGDRQVNKGASLLPYEPGYIGKMKDIEVDSIAHKVVGVDNVDFVISSTNLYDESKLVKGMHIAENGSMAVSEYGFMADILVEPDTIYTMLGFMSAAYYTVDKIFIRRDTISDSVGEFIVGTITTPSNAKYMTVSISENNTIERQRQINKGPILLDYEEYSETYFDSEKIDILPNGVNVDQLNFVISSTNLYNENTLTKGYLLNENGEPVSSGYGYSDYIKVKPATLYIGYGFMSVVYYTADKVFIKRDANSSLVDRTGEYIFCTPANAFYIRLTISTAYNVSVQRQLNEGTILLDYEPYMETPYIDGTKLHYYLSDNEVEPKHTTFLEIGRTINLFNKDAVTPNGYYDAKTFKWVSSSGYVSTDFIPCTEGSIIRTTPIGYGSHVVYKNADGDIFYGEVIASSAVNPRKFTIPAEAVSFSMAVRVEHVDILVVTENIDVPTEYIPYYGPVIGDPVLKSSILDIMSENIEVMFSSFENPLLGKSLAVFGDSISRGYGNNSKGYGEYIAERNNMRIINKSVSGASHAYVEGRSHILQQMQSAQDQKFDYIVFNGLTNDVNVAWSSKTGTITDGYTGPFDTTTFCGGFESCCQLIKDNWHDAKVLFLAVHKMSSRNKNGQEELQGLARDMCKKWSIPFVDIYNEGNLNTYITTMFNLYTSNNSGTPDGTHPNELGYQTFYVDRIESKMKNL